MTTQDRIAIVASALTDDPRQAPRIARTLGFAGLLYEAYSTALAIPDLSPSGRRDFRHLLSAENRQLVGLQCDLGPRGLGPGADVDRVIAQLGRAFEAAAATQAPLVCVDLGLLPPPPLQQKPKPRIRPEDAGIIIIPTPRQAAPAPDATDLPAIPPRVDPAFTAQVDAALRELGRVADRFGVTVAFRGELSSLAALERAILAAACPWFGVDLDPVAVLRDEWEMDGVFSRVGPLIRHVRGRDALRGADRRTKPTPVGAGNVNWAEVLSDLDQAGYHGWITIDPIELPDRTRAALAARDHLGGLL
jgi:sugar phosphate isomerase/epimerase